MHPLNRHLLSRVGLRLQKGPRVPAQFRTDYERQLRAVKAEGRFKVYTDFVYDAGEHPVSYVDHECAFASEQLSMEPAGRLLDVGSYRHFVLGLMAGLDITTVDVRDRAPIQPRETVINTDARALDLPDASFDTVMSLCVIEHVGLGRYGDPLDVGGDLTVADMNGLFAQVDG